MPFLGGFMTITIPAWVFILLSLSAVFLLGFSLGGCVTLHYTDKE